MAIHSIADADVAGKRVLVRVDFNVPLKDGVVGDDSRIRASIPTIELILEKGGSVVLVSHLGRPKGKVNEAMSIAPAGQRLEELLGRTVMVVDDVTGPHAQERAAALQPGEVLLLENVRFDPREEANDASLAKELAGLADIYVNDAFGAAHRAHASTTGVAGLLPSYIGLLMLDELDHLGKLTASPEHPFVAVLGGAKVTDKVGVINELMTRVDALLLGGGIANTFALAAGQPIGASLADRDFAPQATEILQRAASRGIVIHLPIDVVADTSIDGPGEIVDAASVGDDQSIFDIGPKTVEAYGNVLKQAKTIFWNGPMGVFEKPAFAKGTLGVAEAIAASDSYGVVGGGDSLAAIEQSGVGARIDHLSTGGGASLEFLEGRVLPGVAALDRKE
ncbi:MAG: phosphoglycerate kinase [Thermomicrobiales bacterium]|nr:phosphoglycerate kinase [Thermomicrobiales bacterium]